MRKLYYSLLLFVLGMTQVANAIPALRTPFSVKQSDGSVITVSRVGDEFSHCFKSEDGKALYRAENGDFYYLSVNGASKVMAHNVGSRSAEELSFLASEAEALNANAIVAANVKKSPMKKAVSKAAPQRSQVPNNGKVKVPIILVQYKDVKFKDSDPQAVFDEQMNTGAKSVKNYFKDQSYNKFDADFDILGPVTLSNNRSYYGANDSQGYDLRPGEMVKEALDLLEAQGVDFSPYDNNGDGYIDVTYVIYAGVGEATDESTPSSIWPHQWDLYSALGETPQYGSVKAYQYACSNELYDGSIIGIGTFCHEFSHCLGLPDFYEVDYLYGNYGMDYWSLMDYGSYLDDGNTPCAYTAYEREFMGWLTIPTLTDRQSVTLNVLADGGENIAYRVQNPNNEDEYYLLENRQNRGWDEYLTAHGMMVTHVDYDEYAWENQLINAYPSHQRMTIIPADNKLSTATDYGDLYPNGGKNTELTDNSTPAATVFTGQFMGQPITDIKETGEVITFKFNYVTDAPVADEATDVKSDAFTANWEAVDGAASYTLKVRECDGTEVEQLLTESFSKFVQSGNDVSSKLDTYMDNAGWTGTYLYSEIGGLRLSSSSNIGSLTSKAMDMSGAGGVVSVVVDAKSYGSDTGVTMKVSVKDKSGNKVGTQTVNLTSAGGEQVIVLEGADEASSIVFEGVAKKKRIVLNSLAIYTGDYSFNAANAPKLAPGEDKIIEGITGTSYTVTGLNPNANYKYQVKTVYEDGTESKYSNSISVTTVETTGIENLSVANANVAVNGGVITVSGDVKAQVFTLTGAAVPATSFNKFAVAGGVYFVKVGNKTSKVLVK